MEAICLHYTWSFIMSSLFGFLFLCRCTSFLLWSHWRLWHPKSNTLISILETVKRKKTSLVFKVASCIMNLGKFFFPCYSGFLFPPGWTADLGSYQVFNKPTTGFKTKNSVCPLQLKNYHETCTTLGKLEESFVYYEKCCKIWMPL